MEIKNLFLNQDDKAIKALQKLNENNSQIVLIVNSKNQLLGVLNDGDIRRAILSGKSLDIEIESIMNTNFLYGREREDIFEIKARMEEHKIMALPILNENNVPIRMVKYVEIVGNEFVKTPVVIMAGGKGVRMRPHTLKTPKPMLKVGDKPMLEILIDSFKQSGFKNFFISVNYLKDKIIEHFGDGRSWDVEISYLEEAKPLGTAGSLSLLPKEIDGPVIVVNGDVLSRVNALSILEFHSNTYADATIAACDYSIKIPYGIVESMNGKLIKFNEKPTYTYFVNTGMYILSKKVLSLIQSGIPVDMPEILMSAKEKNMNINIFPLREYWIDVGKPEKISEAEENLYKPLI